MPKKTKFGGPGRKSGDPVLDLVGAVRRSPDGTMLAIHWPSPPSLHRWAVADHHGSLGYETPDRIAHWPVIGAVPGTPAAGQYLATQPMPVHPAPRRRHPRDVVDVQLPESNEEAPGA